MSAGLRVIDAAGVELAGAADWRRRVAHLRGALAAAGVARGERVLAWLPRGWEEAALCQAVEESGAVWVSVPRRSAPAQVAELVADAEPRLAVCGAGERARLGPGPWREWPELVVELAAADDAASAGEADAGHDGYGLAALCYTSGSTGRPKGVMVSHGNLAGAAERVDAYLCHTAADRLLALMPLNAPWGLLQWRLAERAGAAVVLPPAAAMAAELARTIRAAGVTGLAALPPTWIQLVDYLRERGETLPGLRYVTTSGGLLPLRILDAFPEVFPQAGVWMTYGLTEAFRTTVVPAAEFVRRKGSLGRPCPGVGIEIVKADGMRAEAGESGELVHTGSCVTAGYWRRPEDTRRAYTARPGHQAVLGAGPVHYSGDRVRRDVDGYLWFEGREDGLIKTGGYRVSADEIEAVLHAVAGVRHAVAGGLPDETLGQRIAVMLETSGDPEGVLAQARAAARAHLASHQQPLLWRVWHGAMPLTANGKLDRPAILRAMIVSGS